MENVDWDFISNTIRNYDQYPPALRIAKYLLEQGITEESFLQVVPKLTLTNGLPGPVITDIHNYIRDIERGSITPEVVAMVPKLNFG